MPLNILASGDGINFGPDSDTGNIEKMLVLVDLNLNGFEDLGDSDSLPIFIAQVDSSSDGGWWFGAAPIAGGGNTKMRLYSYWDGGTGDWAASTSLTTDGWFRDVGFYYDNSSSDNVPRFYINGAGESPGYSAQPSGSYLDGSAKNLTVGHMDIGTVYTMDGAIEFPRIYDLTSEAWAEARLDLFVANIYNSRSMRITSPSPAWAVPLIGASGLQKYGGVTLSSDNQFTCMVSGLRGTVVGAPSGSGLTHRSVGK